MNSLRHILALLLSVIVLGPFFTLSAFAASVLASALMLP